MCVCALLNGMCVCALLNGKCVCARLNGKCVCALLNGKSVCALLNGMCVCALLNGMCVCALLNGNAAHASILPSPTPSLQPHGRSPLAGRHARAGCMPLLPRAWLRPASAGGAAWTIRHVGSRRAHRAGVGCGASAVWGMEGGRARRADDGCGDGGVERGILSHPSSRCVVWGVGRAVRSMGLALLGVRLAGHLGAVH
eukprot:365486-Chlamydomonas_euryale.AAC.2